MFAEKWPRFMALLDTVTAGAGPDLDDDFDDPQTAFDELQTFLVRVSKQQVDQALAWTREQALTQLNRATYLEKVEADKVDEEEIAKVELVREVIEKTTEAQYGLLRDYFEFFYAMTTDAQEEPEEEEDDDGGEEAQQDS